MTPDNSDETSDPYAAITEQLSQELADHIAELRAELTEARKEPAKPEPPKNDEIVESFFKAKGYAADTERHHRCAIKFIRESVDDKPLCDVTEDEVLTFANTWGVDGEPIKPKSMTKYLSGIKVLYDWMGKQPWGPDENVVETAAEEFVSQKSAALRRSGNNTGTVVQPNEYRFLLQLTTEPDTYAVLMLMAKTGLRRKDLTFLKVQDVDLDRKMIFCRQPKGVGEDRIPKEDADQKFMDDECSEAVGRWLEVREDLGLGDSEWLFASERKLEKPVAKMTISRWIKKATNRAAMRAERDGETQLAEKFQAFTPHDARRCFTSWLNWNDCPRDVISALRGDADADMVALYTYYGEDEIRRMYEEAIPKFNVPRR